MDPIALIFASIALVIFLLLVPFSYSILGLWLSEIGLWFAWIPFGMIIYATISLINLKINFEEATNFSLFLVSIIFNLVSFVRSITPFFKIQSTNKMLSMSMKKSLGNDYLHYIKSANCVDFISCVNFKMLYYFTGIRRRILNQRVRTIRNLIYDIVDGKELKLNVHFPRKQGVYPVVLFIHGGGWIIGSKDHLAHERTCKLLANFGYTVFNINYRLISLDYIFTKKNDFKKSPQLGNILSDILTALDFVRTNASDYNGNANDLFLFGRSAGAHLALLTSFLANEKKKISGVVAFYPVTDFTEFYKFFKQEHKMKLSLVNNVFGEGKEYQQIYELFSPISYINEENSDDIPPVFLATGDKDKLVSPKQSIELYNKLQEQNIPSVLLELPWANHAFDLVLNGPGGQLVFKYLTQFLAWILAKKTMDKIEFSAKEQGLEQIISKEKISRIYELAKEEHNMHTIKANTVNFEPKYSETKITET